jgi:hypothetical protein
MIIEAVDFVPSRGLTLFAGKNEQGKTAILRAIQAVFNGCNDPDVIRFGADRAQIMINLDNGYKIKWALNRDGKQTRDVFLNEDGDKKAKPAEYLKGILGNHSFDPIGLLTAKDRSKYLMEAFPAPKVTKEMLQRAGVGDDVINKLNLEKDGFSVLKEAETIHYVQRTAINATKTQKAGAYKEALSKLPENYQPDDVDLSICLGNIEALEKKKTEAETVKEHIERSRVLVEGLKTKIAADQTYLATYPSIERTEEAIRGWREEVSAHKAEIEVLEGQIATKKALLEECQNAIQNASDTLKDQSDIRERIKNNTETLQTIEITEVPDTDAIQVLLDGEYETKKILTAAKEHYSIWLNAGQTIKPELEDAEAKARTLTSIIDFLRNDLPAELTKGARIPIEGLRIEGDKVYIGQKSIDLLSGEEGVTVSLQILRETNKDAPLKLFCVDGWEKLDEEHIESFRQQIKDDEFQFFGTLVTQGNSIPEGALVVKNGAIMAQKDGIHPNQEGLF